MTESLIMYIVIGILLFSWILYLIAGFKEGIIWGLCMIFFVPLSPLLFTVLHWKKAQMGFYSWILGIVIVLVYANVNHGAVEEDIQDVAQIVEPENQEEVEVNIAPDETSESTQETVRKQMDDSELEKILMKREEEDRLRQQADAELEKKRSERRQQTIDSFLDDTKSADWYQ